MRHEVKTVGVIGGGYMGMGIAEVNAAAGLRVVVRDLAQFLDGAKQRIETSLNGQVKRGRIDAAKRDEILGRITFTSELSDVANCDLILEAVPESPDLKKSVLGELDEIVTPDVVIGTNTSSIPIAELAGAVKNPGRIVGIHFFGPVPAMKLVEVVVALDTSPETVEIAKAHAERLGKHPILTGDRSGFIVNFLLVGQVIEAIRMFEQGFASKEDIDNGMKFGAGHPMGPLALADLIGLDVIDAIANSLFDEFKRDQYASPALLKRMIAAGRLGRKSGRGFYEYA
ncbi:3-hydroxybutyryl-CoA dehydrogenase [Smaragdicoccus niigatensis]|uniref:3-hydroxybutyryl-CoA dehydrogenase n=1 Tax=Smaragdicoccus niigatensis TaxID=359359 RepID=UPI0003718543|nr:3-hydroxybutyryl-CoA dehydrogenase [Smaragdicoccus niigatensis]